jgi:DNA-binding GntR family transcriptional regulator
MYNLCRHDTEALMEIDGLYLNKADAVAASLRARIESREMRPGQRLQQDELAQQLGVSSTPVREALRRLEAEGLVIRVPHKGVTVRGSDTRELREAYPIRALLEGYAARLAAERISAEEIGLLDSLQLSMRQSWATKDVRAISAANERWHTTVCRAAGSELLLKTIRRIWAVCPLDVMWTNSEQAFVSIDEHEKILEALRAHDSGRAETAMAEHSIGHDFLHRFLQSGASDHADQP